MECSYDYNDKIQIHVEVDVFCWSPNPKLKDQTLFGQISNTLFMMFALRKI